MSVSYSFTPDRSGQRRLSQDPNGPLGAWFLRKGNRWVNGAKARANVDTGLMRSRIEFRVEVDALGLVGVLAAKTNYAKFVHDGTRWYAGNPFLMDAIRADP